MNASFAALAYLVSGVLFILSLRGLSSPETSRQGNTFGMIGMGLAVGVTLLTLWSTDTLDPLTLGLIAGGVIVGGGAGALIAARVQMTPMPPLVAPASSRRAPSGSIDSNWAKGPSSNARNGVSGGRQIRKGAANSRWRSQQK